MSNDPINLLDSAGLQKLPKQFDEKFAEDCAKRVTKKVVDKTLNAWKNSAANKEYQQLTDAAQDRAKDSAEPYKNKLEQTAVGINYVSGSHPTSVSMGSRSKKVGEVSMPDNGRGTNLWTRLVQVGYGCTSTVAGALRGVAKATEVQKRC